MRARDVLAAATGELAFQAFVIETAERFGWAWFHDQDPRRNNAGFPDLVLGRPGPRGLIVAELKSERGRVTAAQRVWLDLFAAAGVETHVWRPRDADQVLARLKGNTA